MTDSLSLRAANRVHDGFNALSGKMDGVETRADKKGKSISETQTSSELGDMAARVGSGRVTNPLVK